MSIPCGNLQDSPKGNACVSKGAEQAELPPAAPAVPSGTATLKTCWAVSAKARHTLDCDTVILLRYLPIRNAPISPEDVDSAILWHIIHNSKETGNNPNAHQQ